MVRDEIDTVGVAVVGRLLLSIADRPAVIRRSSRKAGNDRKYGFRLLDFTLASLLSLVVLQNLLFPSQDFYYLVFM